MTLNSMTTFSKTILLRKSAMLFATDVSKSTTKTGYPIEHTTKLYHCFMGKFDMAAGSFK